MFEFVMKQDVHEVKVGDKVVIPFNFNCVIVGSIGMNCGRNA